MNPVSQPVILPQPNQISYGVDSLALFPSFTRESYRATFGEEAPPWDPARRAKYWFDSTVAGAAAGSKATYLVVGRAVDGDWAVQPMVLSANEAATVNLPGAVAYPQYVIRPTSATRGGAPVNPMYLSLESEARTLMAELGGSGIVDEGISVFAPVYYPSDEPRRMWSVTLSGGRQDNVGGLLRMRNAGGVGSPGRWRDAQGVLAWIADQPAPTGFDDSRAPVEIPVRALLPNEELRSVAMGLGVFVFRTDLEEESFVRNVGFTAEDRRKLGEVYRIVSRLGLL